MAHNSWLEQIYYFAEYYFYEPQHIFKVAKDGCKGKEYVDEARKRDQKK